MDAYRRWVYAIRCKVGILLKLAGCALIHGRGNHLWGPAVEVVPGVLVAACRSCGAYQDVQPERV